MPAKTTRPTRPTSRTAKPTDRPARSTKPTDRPSRPARSADRPARPADRTTRTTGAKFIRPEATPSPEGDRLQKILAHAGVASRRACEELITAGRVKINGHVVTELGTRAQADVDLIELDGQPIVLKAVELQYYLLYKPVGYISTVSDPHGRKTALSLVPTDKRLYPVGRLDFESEGLLLFTNDGELTHRLLHPRFEHEREYFVQVQGIVTGPDVEKLSAGIHMEDGVAFYHSQTSLLPADFRWRRDPVMPGTSWLRIVLKEGHKRQIRLMLKALNFEVIRLIRIRMGDLVIGNLKPGEGRWLRRLDVLALRRLVHLVQAEPETKKKQVDKSERTQTNNDRHRRASGLRQEHRRRPARG